MTHRTIWYEEASTQAIQIEFKLADTLFWHQGAIVDYLPVQRYSWEWVARNPAQLRKLMRHPRILSDVQKIPSVTSY